MQNWASFSRPSAMNSSPEGEDRERGVREEVWTGGGAEKVAKESEKRREREHRTDGQKCSPISNMRVTEMT